MPTNEMRSSRSTTHEADLALAARAAAQHGLVCRADVAEFGLSPGAVYRRVSRGRWEVVAPGVWRIAGSPTSWHQHLRAGLMWLGAGGHISGLAAAPLWRFDNYPPRPVEFVVPRHMRGVSDGPYEVHTTISLDPIDRAMVDGFAVTSASRTVIDLAARNIAPALLGDAIDSAIRDGHSSPVFLARRIAALRGSGRSGIRRLDEQMLDAGGHTRLERAFLTIVRQYGLPRPVCQVIHRRDGVTVARVDFEFVPHPLVVEVSGRRGHVTERDRIRDARRRNELQLEGIRVIEFLSIEVFRQPDVVARRLGEALAIVGGTR